MDFFRFQISTGMPLHIFVLGIGQHRLLGILFDIAKISYEKAEAAEWDLVLVGALVVHCL